MHERDTFVLYFTSELIYKSISYQQNVGPDMPLQDTENGCPRDCPGIADSHLGSGIQHPGSLPGASPQLSTCNDNHPPPHGIPHPQLSIHMPSKYSSTPNNARSFAMEMKLSREKAILVDRFSRVAFPLAFTILNGMYWYIYFDW